MLADKNLPSQCSRVRLFAPRRIFYISFVVDYIYRNRDNEFSHRGKILSKFAHFENLISKSLILHEEKKYKAMKNFYVRLDKKYH